MRLGWLAGTEPVTVEILGFPDAQHYRSSGAIVFDTEQVRGKAHPLSRIKRGRLVIQVESGAPAELKRKTG